MSDEYAGPFGECPDITIPCVAREIDELRAEVLLLRSQLEVARDQLAVAKALADRRGW